MFVYRPKTHEFIKSRQGGVVLLFALSAPVVFAFFAAVVTYSGFVANKIKLQQAADAAVLAVVGDMRVSDGNQSRLESVARTVALSQLEIKTGDASLDVTVTKALPVTASVNFSITAASGATVILSRTYKSVISYFPGLETLRLTASASANFSGSTKVCVVSLESSAADAIHLKDNASIDARDCSVYANSKSAGAIRSEGASLIKSGSLCSAGGYAGTSTNYLPVPKTDCPAVKDPLADRPAPPPTNCDYTDLRLIGVTRTLSPGTYCGGLVVDKGAQVTLNPGIYVIKDGALIVGPGGSTTTKTSSNDCEEHDRRPDTRSECGATSSTSQIGYLRGTNVGFYFTGTVSAGAGGVSHPMRFMKDSVVELTAPKTGPLAGLLFFEDRAAASHRLFEVMSNNARKLVGTIYLSKGTFSVNSTQTVADQSEYTAIIVNKLDLAQALRLVINTNYFSTDVPVPNGIGPYSSVVSLTR
jgi:Flp pilus assembly protein TadG